MPRKSAAAVDIARIRVDGKPERLEPPTTLSDRERELFIELVDANTPEHFRIGDRPLLCRYVEAAVLAEQAAHELRKNGPVINGKASPWLIVQEKAVRAQIPLSMRLRLSPQSRFDGRSAARAQVYTGPKPWELCREETEEQEVAE